MGVEISFKFPDWAERIKAHEAQLNLFTAAQIQTNRGMLFDAEGGRNGHQKWVPLRLRSGQILSNRGTLRQSIAPFNPRGEPGPDGIVKFAGDVIMLGTRLGYARMMNDGTTKMPGGVLRARNAKALKIPLPSGASATQATRKIRSATVYERIATLESGIAKAVERTAKTRSRFTSSGSDKDLNAAVRSEIALSKRRDRIEAMRSRANNIMTTGRGGDQFMFRKSVRIPARNFTDWNDNDQEELDAALLNKVIEVLNG